jgi:predicted nucleic acid-binding protein
VTGLVVLDSSALVALLLDAGPVGDWVTSLTQDTVMAAPELAMFEAANVVRRQQLAGTISPAEATLVHEDLQVLPLQLWPYLPLAERAWALRDTLTAHDASYVALAELLDVPLVTLDERLGRANGPKCPVLTPPRETMTP